MLKRIAYSLIAAMVLAVPVSAAPWVSMKITFNYNTYNYSAEAVYVNVNGRKLENLPMQPILLENTTLVPAREVCEAFGAIVEWKKPTEEIYIACGDSLVLLKVNSKTAIVNGVSKELTVPPRIINNKTMIPVRFVSEAFNKDVVWSNAERMIYIKDKAVSENTTQQPSTQGVAQQTQTVPTSNIFDQNIMYDSINKTLILKNANSSFTTEGSTLSYDNSDKTLKIQFTADVASGIKQGTYSINTNGVQSINYSVESGKTTIIINSENKLTPNFESDKNYIYITFK